ncbi:MAG: glutathione S-transferase family protein [Deltaproteobacteria bacterium]|nr:glutathione S-transferase family protein [Deltaproteobacteria bacterium]
MLTVYHLETSRSDRVIWLLEELGLDYQVVTFDRDPKTMRAPEAMKALHPLAKAPMLGDGDRILIESGAIFEYLLGRYGDQPGRPQLAPKPSDPDWPDYLQWLHFAEGSAMLPMLLDHFEKAGMCGPVGSSQIAGMARSEMDRLFKALDGILAKQEWMAGPRFTAADCMMGWYIEMIELRGEIAPYPALQRYVAKLAARPARQRAKARAQKAH